MAINRFDRQSRYDWGWETSIPVLPQLNFEGLDAVMAQTQMGIDQGNLISTKMPNALPTVQDQQLFQEYKSTIDNGLKQVTDIYANQGLKAGQAAQNQFLRKIQDAWSSGGIADVLNQRYQGYGKAVEELKKFRTDDKRGINSKYAQYDLNQMLEAPINYNPATRQYQTITTPELFKDPDLRVAAQEMLKNIEEDGGTQFSNLSPGIIQKIQSEGRSAEKLRLAMAALMEMPEFVSQIDRDTFVQTNEYGLSNTKRDASRELNKTYSKVEGFYNKAKNSKDPKEIREFQNYLSQQGYSVPANGKFDADTQAQADKFLNDAKSVYNKKPEEIDDLQAQDFVRSNIKENYLNYAGGFANLKVEKDLIFDKVYLQRQKIAADRANTQALIASNEKFLPMKADDTSVVASQPVQLGNFVQALDKGKQTQMSAYQTAEQIKAQDPMFKGWKNEDIVAAYREFENVVKANPGANPNDLKSMFNQRFSNYLQGQGNTGVPGEQLFEYVSQGRNSPTIASIDSLWSADESVNSMAGLISDYGKTYVTTPEGQSQIKEMRNLGFGSGMNDVQLMEDITSNPSKYNQPTTPSFVSSSGIGGGKTQGVTLGTGFISTMSRNIEKQSTINPGLYKETMSGSAILQGKGDEFLVPVLNRYGEDINNGAYGSYVSEGGQGALFYKMPKQGEGREGADIDAGTFKYESIAVDLDENGKTVIVYSGTGKDGKKDVPAYTRITPTAYQIGEIRQGLAGQLAMANQSGDYQKQLEIGKKILGLGDAKWSDYRNFDVAGTKLNNKNTSDEPVYQMINGTPTRMEGFRISNDRLKNQFTDGQNIYETEVVHAWSPFTNTSKTLNVSVIRDANGREIKVAIPTSQGTLDYGSAANVIINNKNKEILATIPVEMEATKIPEGNYIESPVNSRRLKTN